MPSQTFPSLSIIPRLTAHCFYTRGFIFNKKTPSDYKLPLVMFGLQFISRVSAHTSCDD